MFPGNLFQCGLRPFVCWISVFSLSMDNEEYWLRVCVTVYVHWARFAWAAIVQEHGQRGVKLSEHSLPHASIVYSNHFLPFLFTVFFATWGFGGDSAFAFFVGVKPRSFGCISVWWRLTDSVCYGNWQFVLRSAEAEPVNCDRINHAKEQPWTACGFGKITSIALRFIGYILWILIYKITANTNTAKFG